MLHHFIHNIPVLYLLITVAKALLLKYSLFIIGNKHEVAFQTGAFPR